MLVYEGGGHGSCQRRKAKEEKEEEGGRENSRGQRGRGSENEIRKEKFMKVEEENERGW